MRFKFNYLEKYKISISNYHNKNICIMLIENYDQIKKAVLETNNKYKNFKIDEILKEVEKEYNNTVISEEIIY